ncbi:hypothetical protein BDY19DRAFT_686686 [Irpex rosettiformis]|uniref:Uncharacterized protein n=1 Tax=Irpex rosettiformis TaxID=378272 RepID=A0ACB8UA79_9APHY|nr:hypothetical protein BDY19DRAFT_686686 [Irpex rosettiformis]
MGVGRGQEVEGLQGSTSLSCHGVTEHYSRMSPRLVILTHHADTPDLPVATPGGGERAPETPSNYIPGLITLGSTYNVLNGKYADSRSALQQVVDWNKSEVRIQVYGGKEYSVPDVVNFNSNTTSDYTSSYGKTTSDYTKSLSTHAGFEASFPGFSASASADYSESQRESLSNAFTRITFAVTHYNLSLPPTSQTRGLLKPWFVEDLDKMDPIDFYREYGTHLLRSLTVGGRALFLNSTDTRKYSSSMSIEAAAKVSASYLVASGSIELSAAQKQAMESFNESSNTSVATKGGDPRYGNEEFLKNVEAWAGSIIEYPEFVDFGSLPCFVGLWEFASTQARRDALKNAYAQFVKLYTADLTLPGPYLEARSTTNFDDSKNAPISVGSTGYEGNIIIKYPVARSDGFYLLSPSPGDGEATTARELVPGALAPVKWEEAFVGPYYKNAYTRVWRAIPPTSDYIALGFVSMTRSSISEIPAQPPASLADQFRAVHKLALTGASKGVSQIFHSSGNRVVFEVDYRYWHGDTEVPVKSDCFVLDPKMTIKNWSGW